MITIGNLKIKNNNSSLTNNFFDVLLKFHFSLRQKRIERTSIINNKSGEKKHI